MPCHVGPTKKELLDMHMPAVLCAVVRKIGDTDPFWDDIDWKEAGVSRATFDEWWKIHHAQDERRKGGK